MPEKVSIEVPTPFGLISVRASGEQVEVDSSVPLVLDLEDQPVQELPAGRHKIKTG